VLTLPAVGIAVEACLPDVRFSVITLGPGMPDRLLPIPIPRDRAAPYRESLVTSELKAQSRWVELRSVRVRSSQP
jgi:hypothetical protein